MPSPPVRRAPELALKPVPVDITGHPIRRIPGCCRSGRDIAQDALLFRRIQAGAHVSLNGGPDYDDPELSLNPGIGSPAWEELKRGAAPEGHRRRSGSIATLRLEDIC
jgi:hypothetical protein